MFFRTSLMVFFVCVLMTYAVADEKAAANKISVETTVVTPGPMHCSLTAQPWTPATQTGVAGRTNVA